MLKAGRCLWYLQLMAMLCNGINGGTDTGGSIPLVEQEEAVRNLIARILPGHRQLFRVQGIGHCRHSTEHSAAGCFDVQILGGLVYIQGTSGTGTMQMHHPHACVKQLTPDLQPASMPTCIPFAAPSRKQPWQHREDEA